MPIEVEQRWHNRSTEVPVLIEARDWVSERRIFSTLVWPVLEGDPDSAALDHFERVQQVKEVIAKGGREMALSTMLSTDWGLTWNHDRKCWIAGDGYAYDGWRETDIRSGQEYDPGRGHNGAAFLSLGRPLPAVRAENEEAS